MKIVNNWIEGGEQFLKKWSGQKGKGERKYRICRGDGWQPDTDFRKSSLENLFLKVVVPGTSKQWSCYTDPLVFCLKFRLICLRVPKIVL